MASSNLPAVFWRAQLSLLRIAHWSTKQAIPNHIEHGVCVYCRRNRDPTWGAIVGRVNRPAASLGIIPQANLRRRPGARGLLSDPAGDGTTLKHTVACESAPGRRGNAGAMEA